MASSAKTKSEVIIQAPQFDRPEVEIRASAKRKKTGTAHWAGSRIVVQIPVSLKGKARTQFVDDLVNPSHSDMFLFCMQVLFALPNYQPIKDRIKFECILGDTVSKIIELENNSKKTITYFVKYEGSSDFVLEDQNVIKIEGNSSYKYKVSFSYFITFC